MFEHLSKQHPLMATLIFLLLLNHGVSVDNTDNGSQTPLRAAASNVHLEVTRQSLSNGGIVHITRKRDLSALLAAANIDQVEVFP